PPGCRGTAARRATSSGAADRRVRATRRSGPAGCDRTGRPAPWRPAVGRSLRFGPPRGVRVASGPDGGREQVELSGAGVVPQEVEGPGAGGDALVVADPPGSVFPACRRAVRVESSGGYLQRGPEAEL